MEEVIVLSLICEMSSGTLVEVVKKTTGKRCAMIEAISENTTAGSTELFRNDVNALIHLEHKNILAFRSVCPLMFDHPKAVYRLITEPVDYTLEEIVNGYCDGGNAVPSRLIRYILRQILLGIHYCHKRNIVHTDLSLKTVLVKANKNAIRIAGFGRSVRGLTELKRSSLHTITSPFQAPEFLDRSSTFTHAVDMWSVGVTFATMAFGKCPFSGHTREEIFQSIIRFFFGPSALNGLSFDQSYHSVLETVSSTNPRLDLATSYPALEAIGLKGVKLLESLLLFHPGRRCDAEQALFSTYFD